MSITAEEYKVIAEEIIAEDKWLLPDNVLLEGWNKYKEETRGMHYSGLDAEVEYLMGVQEELQVKTLKEKISLYIQFNRLKR